MRTLLNESFPPNYEPTFFPPEPARIFSPGAVLGKLDNLVEVGVGETVIATTSTSPDALDRGVAVSLSKNPRAEAASVSARNGCAEHLQTEKGAGSP